MKRLMSVSKRVGREARHWRSVAHESDLEKIWGWSGPAGKRRAARRLDLLCDAAGLAPGRRALEIGCGGGTFTRGLAATGADLCSVDIVGGFVLRARQRCASKPASFALHDAHSLGFADHAFNAVIGVSVLHHLDPKRALAEIYRVLAPAGRLAFSEPNMMNPQIALQKNISPLKRALGDTEDETAFFRWKLRRQIESAGFNSVEVRPFDFLHPLVPAALVAQTDRLGRLMERIPMLREIAGSLLITASR